MLQLISIVCCASFLAIDWIISIVSIPLVLSILDIVYKVIHIVFLVFFICSWLLLCKIFYVIYGSLYHLRKKRFLKYTKPIAGIYEKFFHKTFYEKNYRERGPLAFNSFPNIDSNKLQKLIKGGTILFLYNDTEDYADVVKNFITETISSGDTVDYITTYKSPLDFCKAIPEQEIYTITRKLSIIDCFSPHYSFDDKVMKFAKQDLIQKGFKFFEAESFAEVHTAANNSWYRFRKICQAEENSYRIPHRTVYDTLSSLISFSSEEQYLLFLRHVISSEKSYGMISLLIEPLSLKNELRFDLIRTADVVIELKGGSMVQTK